MSIFRTIRKIADCKNCLGTGTLPDGSSECTTCEGTGKVEVYSRVSQTAAAQSQAATKMMHPGPERAEAKARLEDHEPEPVGQDEPPVNGDFQPKGKQGKVSKVGKGFIDEE